MQGKTEFYFNYIVSIAFYSKYLVLFQIEFDASCPQFAQRISVPLKSLGKINTGRSIFSLPRSITQYPSDGRFHREIRSFSRRLFSHLRSSKSKKIALFCYLT